MRTSRSFGQVDLPKDQEEQEPHLGDHVSGECYLVDEVLSDTDLTLDANASRREPDARLRGSKLFVVSLSPPGSQN